MTTSPLPMPPVPAIPAVPERYLARLRTLLEGGERRLLGLVGPPGAGKSTLAQVLHAAFPEVSQIVPMDGYHLAQVELERLGRAGRKGAPDTFDAAGYIALLKRLRHQPADETVYAPDFRRDIEEPIAGAIPVHPRTRLVITEGNYLLLEDEPWVRAVSLLDEVWYVGVDDTRRTQWLVARHERYGRSPEAARAWVEQTDEPNARRIAASRHRAHLDFDWG